TFEVAAPLLTAETSNVIATLRGIGCNSSICVAAGDGGVVAHNEGSGWQGGPTGIAVDFTAVACTSTACHITGTDGSIHTAQIDFPTESGTPVAHALRGITCAANVCVAVGDSGTMLGFNGTTWSPISSGTTNNLDAVGCWSDG